MEYTISLATEDRRRSLAFDRDGLGLEAFGPLATSQMDLSATAKAFRVVHGAIGVIDLVALGYVWTCAVTRRRGRLLPAAAAALLFEGGALVVGRGNCPLGPLQTRLGDPVPLFELVLPKRAAKAAVPVLAGVSIAGLALAAIRTRSLARTG